MRSHLRNLVICFLLVLCTTLIYYSVLDHPFLNLDDQVYVTQNRHVQSGLSLKNIEWAFTTLHAEFYHPVTWLSLLADTTLYGVHSRGYLTTNLNLHILNTLLVFIIFSLMTGCPVRSAFLAALFAVHPIHVESVAWIADRKDLVCAFFSLLTIGAYALYAFKPRFYRYLCVFFCLILSILSKPMAITLPAVLLLLDLWPLNRLELNQSFCGLFKNFSRLILEKIPLLIIAVIGGVIAIFAQQQGGGLGTLNEFPMIIRINNIFLSYFKYIGKTIWPSGLTIFYPYVTHPSMLRSCLAASAILVITGIAIVSVRRFPFFAVGWLWFLGTLVPVIGIFKIGDFSMADRYMYLPIVGLLIIFVWGGADFFHHIRAPKWISWGTGGMIIAVLSFLTWQQTHYWKNNETLYRHALNVTQNNYMAHYGLGHALASEGRFKGAIYHFKQASKLDPNKVAFLLYLARAQATIGKYSEAGVSLKKALKIDSTFPETQFTYGLVLIVEKKYELALNHLLVALEQAESTPPKTERINRQTLVAFYCKLFGCKINPEIREEQKYPSDRANLFPEIKKLSWFYFKQGDVHQALITLKVSNDPKWLINAIINGYDNWLKEFGLKKDEV